MVVAFPHLLCSAAVDSTDADDILPAPPNGPIQQTNAQEVVQVYSQFQEQLRATQLAIQQNRQEAKAAAAQAAESVSNALQAMQETFATEHTREQQVTRELNRRILVVAGGLAAIAFLTTLLVTCFQWQVSNGLAAIATALSAALRPSSEAALESSGRAGQPYLPLFAATEVAQNRPCGLESASWPAVKHRRAGSRSIERLLFPKPGDSLRRRQFRALRTALYFGLLCAAVVGLVLYLLHSRPWM